MGIAENSEICKSIRQVKVLYNPPFRQLLLESYGNPSTREAGVQFSLLYPPAVDAVRQRVSLKTYLNKHALRFWCISF